jgi:hypothetical protein
MMREIYKPKTDLILIFQVKNIVYHVSINKGKMFIYGRGRFCSTLMLFDDGQKALSESRFAGSDQRRYNTTKASEAGHCFKRP